ncbi:MAG: amidase family protein, partial [Pseudomonadota bacterium]
ALRRGAEIDAEARAGLADRLAAQRAAAEAALLGDADAVLLPATPIRTPPVAEIDRAGPGFRPRTLFELSAYTRFVNRLGWPAAAVPAGRDARGLPVAAQLVGRPGSDAAILALAAAFPRAPAIGGPA